MVPLAVGTPERKSPHIFQTSVLEAEDETTHLILSSEYFKRQKSRIIPYSINSLLLIFDS